MEEPYMTLKRSAHLFAHGPCWAPSGMGGCCSQRCNSFSPFSALRWIGGIKQKKKKKNETRWMKLSTWCRRIDTACPGRTSWLAGNQETASWKMWTSKQSQYVNKWWGKAIFGWRNCINKDTVHRIFVEEWMPSFPFLGREFGEQGRRQSCWKQLMREVEELPCGMKVWAHVGLCVKAKGRKWDS